MMIKHLHSVMLLLKSFESYSLRMNSLVSLLWSIIQSNLNNKD